MFDFVPDGYQMIETHCHNHPVSSCSQLEVGRLSELYKSLGYKTIILTNHYRNRLKETSREETIARYLDAYDREREIGEQLGLNVLLGAEITIRNWSMRSDGVMGEVSYDFLLYGITKEVINKYYPFSLFSQIGLYEICQSHDIVMIQAHPYRNHHETANLRYMDGIEVFNPHHYTKQQFEKSYRDAKNMDMIMTCGTDCHEAEAAGDSCMIIPKEIETIEDFRDYLKTKPAPFFGNRKLGLIDVSNPPEYAEKL